MRWRGNPLGFECRYGRRWCRRCGIPTCSVFVLGGEYERGRGGGHFWIAVKKTIGINHNERRGPAFSNEIIPIVRKTFRALRHRISTYPPSTSWKTYEIPSIIIHRRDFSLKVHPTLPWDDVMVAQALVPQSHVNLFRKHSEVLEVTKKPF